MECLQESPFKERTLCILSYNGSDDDIAINYMLLIISLRAILSSFYRYNRQLNSNRQKIFVIERAECFVFGGVVLFQVALCLVLGCAGISIIWCALLGYMLYEVGWISLSSIDNNVNEVEGDALYTIAVPIAMLLCSLGVIYYAIYSPIITTIAHILAIILGSGEACLLYMNSFVFSV